MGVKRGYHTLRAQVALGVFLLGSVFFFYPGQRSPWNKGGGCARFSIYI